MNSVRSFHRLAGVFALTGIVSVHAADFSVTPGADLIFRANMAAMNKSAMFREFDSQQNDPEMEAKMLAATGLKKTDVLGVSGSVDLEDLAGLDQLADPTATLGKVPAVLQVYLAKPVSQQQMIDGIKLLSSNTPAGPGAALNAKVEGDVVQFTGEGEEGTNFFGALGADGKSLFISPNAKSANDAFARSKAGQPIPVPPEFAQVLDVGAHISMAIVLPAAARKQIEDQITGMKNSPEPGAAMQAAMFAPFAAMKSFSLGVKFNDADMDIGAALDLGTDVNATQANTTLSMFTMMLASQMGPVGQKLRLAPEGSAIKLKMNVTKSEIEGAAKGFAPGGAPPSDF